MNRSLMNRQMFREGGAAGFPDLSGDGKITQKDILMGRGVIGMQMGGDPMAAQMQAMPMQGQPMPMQAMPTQPMADQNAYAGSAYAFRPSTNATSSYSSWRVVWKFG
jgi:hypothetical protein